MNSFDWSTEDLPPDARELVEGRLTVKWFNDQLEALEKKADDAGLDFVASAIADCMDQIAR